MVLLWWDTLQSQPYSQYSEMQKDSPPGKNPCITLMEGAFQLMKGMSVLPALQS